MKWNVSSLLTVGLLLAAEAMAQAPLIVAHRGASHDAPENTLAAFELAWEKGADGIEGDFYLTTDGRIACIHDKTTERVTSKLSNLPVAKSTLAELQPLDVGSWKAAKFAGERVPSFEQVLATVPKEKRFFVEIKCGPEIVPALKQALQDASFPAEQTRIISFNEKVIAAAKQAIPEVEAYWLSAFHYRKKEGDTTGGWHPTVEEIIARAKAVYADGVDLEANTAAITPEFVAAVRDAGLSLHVWTVNDPEKAAVLQSLGIDSITTNRPALLRERLFANVKLDVAPTQQPQPVAAAAQ